MATKELWALEKVTKLVDAPKPNRIELALALANLEEAKAGGVADLTKVRGKQRRALYALLAVGRWLKLVRLPMSRCVRIGWAKLLILAGHCRERPGMEPTPTELDQAEKYTWAQLAAILKNGPKGKIPPKAKSIMLRLNGSQYAVFEAAIRRHGAVRVKKGKGLHHKEKALTAFIRKAQAAGV